MPGLTSARTEAQGIANLQQFSPKQTQELSAPLSCVLPTISTTLALHHFYTYTPFFLWQLVLPRSCFILIQDPNLVPRFPIFVAQIRLIFNFKALIQQNIQLCA